MARVKKYYVVWKGRVPGVYADWNSAKAQIEGFEGARFKGFLTEEEAENAYREGVPTFRPSLKPDVKPEMNQAPKRCIVVDAACSGNPGPMEYRGISLWDEKEIFHMKFDLGTNNIGEFLAIVHALALLQKIGMPDIPIYSDSQIAIGWVKAAKCRTKLTIEPATVQLFELVQRAEKWLLANPIVTPINKWPTAYWGEIPADFGRK
ncbi:MAG: ribonuclease H family protein [Bacteroidales bacterium]|nr:ribonuclease H family protein [Bacteroidales bacterium]